MRASSSSRARATLAIGSKSLLALLVALLYFVLAFHPIWDVDIFWHIQAGNWIVANLGLPSTDIFSAVDPEREWHTFQWLYEVVFYAVDRSFGLTGVRLLHALVTVGAFGVLLGWFWKERSFAQGLFAVALVAVMFADRMRVRPDAFNLLFFFLLLPMVTSPRLTRRSVIAIVALVGLWANVHGGGALLAPIMLGSRLVGRSLEFLTGGDEDKPGWRGLWLHIRVDLASVVLTVAVMACMPGFVQGTIHAFTMLGPSKQFIPEWISTYEFLFEEAVEVHEFAAGLLPLVGFVALLVFASVRAARNEWSFRNFPFLEVALAMPMVFLCLEQVRFIWLGAVPALLLLLAWHRGPLEGRWNWVVPATALVAAASLIALALHYHVVLRNLGPDAVLSHLSDDLEEGAFPEGAAAFLADARVEGRVLNHAPWGGFLVYKLWPRCTVFTDGRGNFSEAETYILVALQLAGLRRDVINAAHKRNPFEISILPDAFPVSDYSRWDWVLIYQDRYGQVHLRNARKNKRNFERVKAAYADLGLDLDLSIRTEEVFEFERRIRRFWGGRRLAVDPLRSQVAEVKRLAEQGEGDERRDAFLKLAILHYDVGLFRETRDSLASFHALADEPNARTGLLYALALVADGYPLDAVILMKFMARHDPSFRRQLRGDARSLFQLTFAHLVEYMLTIPYNRYRWALDGGKWKEWE